MNQLIDITVTINPDLPIWPNSPGYSIRALQNINEINEANVSYLSLEVHTGTHIDAPLHFIKGGKDTSSIGLDTLIGLCQVIEINDVDTIEANDLEKCLGEDPLPRILIKTNNSKTDWPRNNFIENYVAISKEAAEWLVLHNVKLVGIDYLSIQKFNHNTETHKVLLKNEVVIVESLDLSNVKPAKYNLVCLPLKIDGLEAVPCRVILQH